MSNFMMTEGWKEKLSPGEKLVFISLCDIANDEGECFTLVSSIAQKCSMSRSAVLANMAKLEERTLIEREHRQGRSNIFYVYPGKLFSNPRRICTRPDSAPTRPDSAPTRPDSAPTRPDSAPTRPDSAPITQSNPYLTQSNPYLTQSACARHPEPQAAKVGKGEKVVIDLPAWMSQELWQDIIDHRKSLKCPVTIKALQTVLQELEKHHSSGQNLREMLNQSVMNGWKGLFPIKAAQPTASKNSSGNRNNYFNHEENSDVVCPV